MKATLIKAYRICYLFTSVDNLNKYLYYALVIIEYAHLSAMAVMQSCNYSIAVINSAHINSLAETTLYYICVGLFLPLKVLFTILWISLFSISYKGKTPPNCILKLMLFMFYLWQSVLLLPDLQTLSNYLMNKQYSNSNYILVMISALLTLLTIIITIIQTVFYAVEVSYSRNWMNDTLIYSMGVILKIIASLYIHVPSKYKIYLQVVHLVIILVVIIYSTRFVSARYFIYIPFHLIMLLMYLLIIAKINVLS
jgi:hypothetical protein